MKGRTFFWIVFAMVALGVGGCGGTWSAGTGFDYELAVGEVLYRPDPNSAVGVRAAWPEQLPDETLLLMAVAKFNFEPVRAALVETIFPWWPGLELPAKQWGILAGGVDVEEHDGVWMLGTAWEFLPDAALRPTVETAYYTYSGALAEREGMNAELRMTIGFLYEWR